MGKCTHKWVNPTYYGVDRQHEILRCAHCQATRQIDYQNGFDDVIETQGDGLYLVNDHPFIELAGQLIPLYEVDQKTIE